MRSQSRLVRSLKTGLVDVVDDTAPWIMLGLGVAALADALLLTNALNSIPDWSEVALFALLGIPTYVCVPVQLPGRRAGVQRHFAWSCARLFVDRSRYKPNDLWRAGTASRTSTGYGFCYGDCGAVHTAGLGRQCRIACRRSASP